HVVLWIELVNRIHAIGIHRRWINALTIVCGLMLCILPPAIGGVFFGIVPMRSAWTASFVSRATWCYLAACAVVCVVTIMQRLFWYYHPERSGALLANHTSFAARLVSDTPLTAPGIPTWLSKLPGNEVLKLCVQEKELAIPRLAY